MDQQLSDSRHTLSTQSGKRSLRILEAVCNLYTSFVTIHVSFVKLLPYVLEMDLVFEVSVK